MNLGGVFINSLACAEPEDIVLLAPSWRAIPYLLVILETHTAKTDMKCNEKEAQLPQRNSASAASGWLTDRAMRRIPGGGCIMF